MMTHLCQNTLVTSTMVMGTGSLVQCQPSPNIQSAFNAAQTLYPITSQASSCCVGLPAMGSLYQIQNGFGYLSIFRRQEQKTSTAQKPNDYDYLKKTEEFVTENYPWLIPLFVTFAILKWFRYLLIFMDWLLPEKAKLTPKWEKFKTVKFPDWDKLKKDLHDPNPVIASGAAKTLTKVQLGGLIFGRRSKGLEVLHGAKPSSAFLRAAIDQGIDEAIEESHVEDAWDRALKTRHKLGIIDKLRGLGGEKAISTLINFLLSESDNLVRAHLKLALHRISHSHRYVVQRVLLDQGVIDAQIVLKQLEGKLERDSDNADLIKTRAMAHEKLGNAEEATRDFERVIQLREEQPESKTKDLAQDHIYLANHQLSSGMTDEAIGHYEKALKLDPALAEAHVALGRIFEERGKTQEMEAAYHQAIVHLAEPDPELSIRLGDFYMTQQDYGLARLMYEEGLEPLREELEDDEFMRIISALCTVYQHEGEFDKALGLYNDALLYAEKADNIDHQIKAHLGIGTVYFKKDDYELALNSFLNAVALEEEVEDNEQLVEIYSQVGKAYANLERWVQALEWFVQAAEFAEKIGDDELLIASTARTGIALHYQGKPDESSEKLAQALALAERTGNHKHSGRIAWTMGVATYKRGDFRDSLNWFQKAVDATEDEEVQLSTYIQMGVVHGYLREYDRAFECLNQAASIAEKTDNLEDEATAHELMGDIYRTIGDWDNAIKAFRKAAELSKQLGDDKRTGKVYVDIGSIHFDREEYDEAMEVINKSIAIAEEVNDEATLVLAYLYLCGIYVNRKELNLAVGVYPRALRLAHKLGDNSLLARVYVVGGEMEIVRKDYEKALHLFLKTHDVALEEEEFRVLSHIYFNLGHIWLSLGKWNAAKEMYCECIKTYRELGNELWLVNAHTAIGNKYARKGGEAEAGELKHSFLEEARAHYAHPLQIFTRNKDHQGVATMHNSIGITYAAQEEWNLAWASYQLALGIYEASANLDGLVRVYTNLANMCKDKGNKEQADQFYEQARSLMLQPNRRK